MRGSTRLAAAAASFALVVTNLHAGEPAIKLTRLRGPLYVVEYDHFAKTNYLIDIGPSFVTVIGATWTPDTAKELNEQIKQVTGLPVREVVVPSPDPEWSGGTAYWKSIGARVIAARATCDSLERNWIASTTGLRKFFSNYPDLPLTPPSQCNPDQFSLQNGRIRVLYLGPSHTDADVFVYFPEQKVLDAGSILKEQLGNVAKADLKEYPRTLQKLKALHLDIDTVIAGHWSPIHGPDLIDTYLGFLPSANK
jgi:metallo-beta-lactamase class B